MKIKISLAAAAILTGTALFADSTSLADALKNGAFQGDLGLYTEYSNVKDADNLGFSSASFNMLFSTDRFYGFQANVGSRANHAFHEVDGNEYFQEDKAVLHTANIGYSNDYIDVVLGRQEINLNWVSDFHEALVGVFKGVPDTTIIAAYTQRMAVANYDEPLSRFERLGDDGAYVVDAQWNGVDGLNVNPFVYHVPDIATWFGAKVDYDKEFENFAFGGTLQYTQSDEDVGEDGSFLQVEARGSIDSLNAKVGYFKTDKDAGAGSIGAAGENVNPFEDGDQIFLSDAKTFYAGADYEIGNLSLIALYGYTKYANDGKFHEFDLGVGYALSENLNIEGFVVIGDDNNGGYSQDYSKVTLGAIYSF